MAKVGEDSSSLFRSLRPDDAKFQAGTETAAREAEMRWPLFKTISPKKMEPTPALSPDERRHWTNQERPLAEERKPALSVPGVSSKLAKSLIRMAPHSSPAIPAAPEKPIAKAVIRRTPSESVPFPPKFKESPPEKDPPKLFSKAPKVARVDEEHDPYEEPIKDVHAQLGAGRAETPAPVSAEGSLASVFRRLEEREEVVAKPARRPSSFLGRIGKR